jgi:hypothetical protein
VDRSRVNQQVDMFRHHHDRQQSKFMLLNRPPQSLAEQDTNPVFDKQWPTPIAGERQFMHMPRFVEMTNLLSVRLTRVIGEVHLGYSPRKALLSKPAVTPGGRAPHARLHVDVSMDIDI